jgi:small-conductance mechanosensitive channel
MIAVFRNCLPVIFFAILLGISTAIAAGTGKPEEPFANWDATALRAEQALESDSASTAALEILRDELAGQRTEAAEYSQSGSYQARSIAAQLAALPDPPKEGETEPEEIAKERAELKEQLAASNAPVIAAQEAHKRADVLIREIDAHIRDRITQQLVTLGPSPLIPSKWVVAGNELLDFAKKLERETQESLSSPGNAALFRQRLSLISLLIVAGIGLGIWVRSLLVRRIEGALAHSKTHMPSGFLWAMRNLVRLFFPIIAVGLVFAAISLSSVTPPSAKSIVLALPAMAAYIIVAQWLGHSLLSPTLPDLRLLDVSDETARSGARTMVGLGVVLALELLLIVAEKDHTFSADAIAVLNFPLSIAGAIFLWQFSGVLREASSGEGEHHVVALSQEAANAGVLPVLMRFLQFVAIASAVLAAVGYIAASRQLLNPTIASVGFIGAAFLFYKLLLTGLNAFLGSETGEGEAAEEVPFQILPLVVGVALSAAVAPMLALTWGARTSDLTEIWVFLNEGVSLGEIQLSLGNVVTLLVVFVLGYVITRWLQKIIGNTILPRTRLDKGSSNAILTGLGYAGYTISALIAVSAAGLDLSSLAVVVGALSVGIGFGLQTIVSNFVSGIILLIERPVKEGDWIEVAGISGYVRKISVRSTRIETFDRHDVIVPNSDLITGTVKNMTLSAMTGRLRVPIGVAYGSDIEVVERILLEAARGHKLVLKDPEPKVLFMGFGDSSLDFELFCFLGDVNNLISVRSDLHKEIYANFARDSIEIPFPQRDITVKNLGDLVSALAPRGRPKQSPSS